MNKKTLSLLFGDRARLAGSVVVLKCTKAEEQKMLATWLMQLSMVDETGRDWCSLGWKNGEVRLEPVEE